MPSEKNKIKLVQINKVKIKTEPIDYQPLANYVDDRVELIKQVFSCLKPKTVKAIAPPFLQNKSMEKIQEQCLDEILGISRKRLLSIINSTKCPTDTESSEDEVQKIEEHISLDEISSDDDAVASINIKKSKIKEEVTGENKQYSVLELLELQARARAIRSQLALEPVIKIELDETDKSRPSSDQEAGNSKAPPKKKVKTNHKSKTNSENDEMQNTENISKEIASNGSSLTTEIKNAEPPRVEGKRIKLKRNFRKRTSDDENLENENRISDSDRVRNDLEQTGKDKEKEAVVVKSEEPERDYSSPEVMTILASPETLCISSDDDDNEKAKKKQENSIKLAEIIGRKIQEPVEKLKEKPYEPPEEGEIVDDCENEPEKENIVKNSNDSEDQPKESEKQDNKIEPEVYKSDEQPEKDNLRRNENDEIKNNVLDPDDQDDMHEDCIEIECTDVIEDYKDDEIEAERTVVRDDAKTTDEIEEDEDQKIETVEIDDSSDEENLSRSQRGTSNNNTAQKESQSKNESWNSRWLGSSRVSKILATSRLGNIVRRKIKNSKKEQVDTQTSNTNSPDQQRTDADNSSNLETSDDNSTPKYEEGSVSHYQELIGKESSKDN